MWRKLKLLMVVLVAFVASVGLLGWGYVHSLDLDAEPRANPAATAADLAWLPQPAGEPRGRILAVVTSTASFDQERRRGGFELTELARAYWVFVANGYAVDIASPQGGKPPMVLDEDLIEADYAFLNDPLVRGKLDASLALAEVDPTLYAGVYFVGGKGAMFDFPGNPEVARIVRDIHGRGVIGAVCHGPAALVGLPLENGEPFLRKRRVAGFSNAEELFLIEDARAAFPFLLQDRLQSEAGAYVEGPMYLDQTVVDGRLVTGQNPWSTWSVAEAMVRALGSEPVARAQTAEEISVRLLQAYAGQGLNAALSMKRQVPPSSKHLLLMHAVVAAMQWQIGVAWDLQRLARH